MASVPRFDPNHFASASRDQIRNRAITDCYEPGSTFKAVLAAAALERRRGAAERPHRAARTATGRSATGSSATAIRTAR